MNPRSEAHDRALEREDRRWQTWRCSMECRQTWEHGPGRYGCPFGSWPDYRGWAEWYLEQILRDPDRGYVPTDEPEPAALTDDGRWWERPEHRTFLANYRRAFAEVIAREDERPADEDDGWFDNLTTHTEEEAT